MTQFFFFFAFVFGFEAFFSEFSGVLLTIYLE